MSKVKYNLEHKEVFDTFLLEDVLVKPGKMYGHPADNIGSKLFTFPCMDDVCVKIPEQRVKELIILVDTFNVLLFPELEQHLREVYSQRRTSSFSPFVRWFRVSGNPD